MTTRSMLVLMLLLGLATALAGCADDAEDTGDEEVVGEQEAVEENETPGIGLIATAAATAGAAMLFARRRS